MPESAHHLAYSFRYDGSMAAVYQVVTPGELVLPGKVRVELALIIRKTVWPTLLDPLLHLF